MFRRMSSLVHSRAFSWALPTLHLSVSIQSSPKVEGPRRRELFGRSGPPRRAPFAIDHWVRPKMGLLVVHGYVDLPLRRSSLLVRCFHAKRSYEVYPSPLFDSRINAITTCIEPLDRYRSARMVATDCIFTDRETEAPRHVCVSCLKEKDRKYLSSVRKTYRLSIIRWMETALLYQRDACRAWRGCRPPVT